MNIQKPARARRASAIARIAAIVAVTALTVGAPAAAASPSPARELAQGVGMGDQTNTHVRQLQRALESHGYDVGAPGVDGRFGPLTAAAVRRIQAARGLTVDGVVGQHTRRVLGLAGRVPRPAQQRRSHTSPTATTPKASNAPPAPKPAPASSSIVDSREKQDPFGVIVAAVAFSLAIASIAAVGLAAVRRRLRDASTPLAGRPPQFASEAVIGYVTMAPGVTSADHDRSSAAIVAACHEAGRDLLEIVCDRAEGRPLERHGLTHVLGRIADGEAHGLVVSELRSFTASMRELAALIGWFRDTDATLIALDLDFDTSMPSGRRVAAALIALGSEDAEHARQSTNNGHVAVRASGRPAVSDRPALQERIVSMRSAGMSMRQIAAQLNAERVPTMRGGAQWRPSSIQAALGYRRPGPRDRLPPVAPRA